MKTKTKKKKLKKLPSSSEGNDLQPSDLYTSVVRIAVAQICKSVGYRGAQTSALETLTSVAVKYLQSLATSAVTSANSTGRTECNLYDVTIALEHLHADVGFIGNSDVNRRLCILSDASIVRDTMKFVYSSREIPFAKPLPRCCDSIQANLQCFGTDSVEWKHIPRWLPEFPKVADGGGKTVVPVSENENNVVKSESSRKISKLEEKRKKVSFRIGCRNVIEMSGVCKGRKRVLCEVYDDGGDEGVVNNGGYSGNNNNNVEVKQYVRRKKKKLKLEEQI